MDSYQSTLKLLVQEFETGSDTEFQLGVVLTKIMQALKNNLDGKSKQYKDPALMCIFLANNVHYMVTSVRRYVTFCVSCLHHAVQTVCLANNTFIFTTDQKPRIYLARNGFRDIVGLYSKMLINTKEWHGVRFVSWKYSLIGCTVFLF
jgi:hypothetical protein